MSYRPSARAYVNNYATSQISTEDPKELVLLLYNGAIRFLEQAKLAIIQSNVRKRGENLARVINIIGELNASLNVEAGGETASFLRGLYMNMLVELPKVNLDNNVEVIERTIRYLRELKRLWEDRVMKKVQVSEVAMKAKAMDPKVRSSFSFAA
ncbi:MAG: flagellar export chaperone FliS [Desulfobacterales bacterium]|nr:flagellar export chaperone FliS [Desulfobacterales bacterium]MBF0397960.1 flagellar export chaperone FliS [Desulfobacterales bacterium]